MTLRRTRPPTDDFVTQFKNHLRPSAIANDAFIDFDQIEANLTEYEPIFEQLESLPCNDKTAFITALTDDLMAADNTRRFIDCAFELLGERGIKFVSADGIWAFYR